MIIAIVILVMLFIWWLFERGRADEELRNLLAVWTKLPAISFPENLHKMSILILYLSSDSGLIQMPLHIFLKNYDFEDWLAPKYWFIRIANGQGRTWRFLAGGGVDCWRLAEEDDTSTLIDAHGSAYSCQSILLEDPDRIVEILRITNRDCFHAFFQNVREVPKTLPFPFINQIH